MRLAAAALAGLVGTVLAEVEVVNLQVLVQVLLQDTMVALAEVVVVAHQQDQVVLETLPL